MHSHEHTLLILILIGAITGILCGWFLGEAMESISWLGQLFLDALKMTIVPLIIAAVISGVTSLGDVRKLGKIGGLTVLYYTVTTALAVLIGLIIVNIIQPGNGINIISTSIPANISDRESVGFTEIILSMVSPNLIASAAETKLLPLIVFCLIFAAAVTTIGDKGKIVISFFSGLNEVMMKIVIWIMYFAPIGIFALIASRLGQAGGGNAFWQEISSVGLYILTVILGLTLHAFLLFFILVAFSKRGRNYSVRHIMLEDLIDLLRII